MVVSEKEKDTSSTSGMETSKNTSLLLKYRAEHIVDDRLTRIKEAYKNKDFETFGEITMQDSNQFHAVCLDTYPPIFYLNDTSHEIIKLVHVINRYYNKVICAYTFDAGPNAVIYTLKEYTPLLLAIFSKYFPSPYDTNNNFKDYCNKPNEIMEANNNRNTLVPPELIEKCNTTGRQCRSNDVKYVFVTKPGCGPIKQPLEESLINLETGEYKLPSDKHKRLNIGSTNANNTNNTLSSSSCCPFMVNNATNNNNNNCSLSKNCLSKCHMNCCNMNMFGCTGKIALVVGIIAALGFIYTKKCK